MTKSKIKSCRPVQLNLVEEQAEGRVISSLYDAQGKLVFQNDPFSPPYHAKTLAAFRKHAKWSLLKDRYLAISLLDHEHCWTNGLDVRISPEELDEHIAIVLTVPDEEIPALIQREVTGVLPNKLTAYICNTEQTPPPAAQE